MRRSAIRRTYHGNGRFCADFFLDFFWGRLIPLSPVVKLPKPARLWAAVAPKVASSPRPGWVWSALPAGSIGGATQARGLAA
jgi:hypothetical protein